MSFDLPLSQLEEGQITQTQAVDVYTDRIQLQRINPAGKTMLDLELSDESTRHGDYYYLRVIQTNDAIAWSSPIWIGGHPIQ